MAESMTLTEINWIETIKESEVKDINSLLSNKEYEVWGVIDPALEVDEFGVIHKTEDLEGNIICKSIDLSNVFFTEGNQFIGNINDEFICLINKKY